MKFNCSIPICLMVSKKGSRKKIPNTNLLVQKHSRDEVNFIHLKHLEYIIFDNKS